MLGSNGSKLDCSVCQIGFAVVCLVLGALVVAGAALDL